MAWEDENWQQYEDLNGGFPFPLGTSVPIPFDVERIYTEWNINPLYNGGFPYIVFIPDWAFPSKEYYEAISAPSRKSEVKGNIFSGESSMEFVDADVLQGSLSVSCSMISGDTLVPGGVPTAEMRISISDRLASVISYGAEIDLSFYVALKSGKMYEVPIGVFYIYEAKKKDAYYELVCYDGMKKLDSVKFSSIETDPEKSYTPFEIIQMCCDAAGLEMGTPEKSYETFLGHDSLFNLAKVKGGIETARDLLMHTVQTLNAFAYVDRWGVLQIKSLKPSEPIRKIDPKQRRMTRASVLEYRLLSVESDITIHENDQTQTHRVSYMTLNSDGVSVVLQENPLWSVIVPKNEIETVFVTARRQISDITDELETCAFYPIETEIFGDPSINLFDFLSYDERKTGRVITSPVTSYTWTHHGGHTLFTAGEEAVAGVEKTQAEKAASAARVEMQGNVSNIMRELYLKLMQQGHYGMSNFTHYELGHYTHEELGGKASD